MLVGVGALHTIAGDPHTDTRRACNGGTLHNTLTANGLILLGSANGLSSYAAILKRLHTVVFLRDKHERAVTADQGRHKT